MLNFIFGAVTVIAIGAVALIIAALTSSSSSIKPKKDETYTFKKGVKVIITHE